MTLADNVRTRQRAALEAVAANIVRIRSDNLIERPWGGRRLAAFKGLDPATPQRPIGESFEVSAFPSDAEAGAHPSTAILPDGSMLPLPELLQLGGAPLVGTQLAERYPGALPLLPKFLNVKSLLSVQAHPAGNPECYVVLAADPGATIRLGFHAAVQADAIIARCRTGRAAQERLRDQVHTTMNDDTLQGIIAPLLAQRATGAAAVRAAFPEAARDAGFAELFRTIHAAYWAMLDDLNELPIQAGQVIFNATPERLRAGRPCSAEVHALGSPDEREILLLEIRKPGPTFRVWDNARFPLRQIDIETAVHALNLGATRQDDYIVATLADTPINGAVTVAACADFAIEHIRIGAGSALIHDTCGTALSLHVIAGKARVETPHANLPVTLGRGTSALVPAALGSYTLSASAGVAEVIAVRIPA